MMQNIRIISLSLICTFVLLQTGLSQKLNHILGDVIVEVRNTEGIQSLVQDLSRTSNFRSSIQAKQLIKEPMNLWVLSINPNQDSEIRFLEEIRKNKHTLMAQKNHLSELRLTPNDTRFADQWQYINMGQNGGVEGADIDMDLAWDYTTGGMTRDGDEIVVCVIDDGVVPGHEDWGDNLWINEAEIPDNGIDDDENGYIDDVRGWDAGNSNDNVFEDGSHGSSVAGIVGAQGNNELGVAGVNWDVKMMIVEGGSPEALALASYAYPYIMRKMYNESNGEKGAFVVSTNASWGIDQGQPEDAPIWCDFYNMLGAEGILNFGATANANFDIDAVGDLPTGCNSDYLVSVTNMNRSDEKVTGAGYGLRTIDLGAFGAQTFTIRNSGYGGFGGTSGATPHVAGTAALLYSLDCDGFMNVVKENPAQAALAVKDYILHGVDPNASLTGRSTTGGRLNAHNAVLNLLSSCEKCSGAFGTEVGNIRVDGGTLTWLDNGNVGEVSIRYREIDTEEWSEVTDVSSGYDFNGLLACKRYEYQIKTDCEGSGNTEYKYARVFETDGCCILPSNIDIAQIDGNAVLSWDGVAAASNFVVEFKNSNEQDWQVINQGTNLMYTISNIENCESYEVRIKSECAETSNESDYSEIINILGECGACSADYCDFGVKDVSDEWISLVSIEGVFENVSSASPEGYVNNLDQFEIELSLGEEYTISLSPTFSSTIFEEYFYVVIDFNQDSEFSEDEVIYRSTEGTSQQVTGEFSVPEEALEGITRFRVVMRYDAPAAACDLAGFDYGEIEDYCVNIVRGLCPTEYQATVSDSTFTSLTLEVPSDDRAEMYILDYRQQGDVEFTSITQESNTFIVEDLEECAVYEYRTSVICQGERTENTNVLLAKTRCMTSAVEESMEDRVHIYPNPSTSFLNIDLPSGSNAQVRLLSIDGSTVFLQQKVKAHGGLIQLSVEGVPSGVFFVDIVQDENRTVKKLIKL